MAKSTKVKEDKKQTESHPELVITEVKADDKEVKVPMPDTKEFAKIEPIPIKVIPQEEKTDEQKVLDYVANSHSEKVDLTPLIRSLYPVASFAEPAKYLQQQESKKIKNLIGKLKFEGRLVLENDSYLKLGSPYWHDSDPKTRHYTVDSVKIIAIK